MATTSPFTLYQRLGLSVFSLDLSFDDNLNKKTAIYPMSGWKDAPCVMGKTGYALKTGKEYGTTAIDIADVSLPHNEKLYSILMKSCNLVANTREGFHFIFSYRSALKNCSNHDLALDIRNGGHLYVEPSHYVAHGETVEYKWIKTSSGNHLNEIPQVFR